MILSKTNLQTDLENGFLMFSHKIALESLELILNYKSQVANQGYIYIVSAKFQNLFVAPDAPQ